MTHLVIGGAGMTGRAIVSQLLDRGERVRVFDIAAHPDKRIEMIVGDLRQPAAVRRAVEGVTTVYHTAAVINQDLGQPVLLRDVNVTGTATVIAACQAAGVRKLVFTSSMDVVFAGRPIVNGDDSLPYSRRPLDYYSRTKIESEQAVLAANSRTLMTVALRAVSVYGPHDRNRFPPIIDIAKRGGFVRMGDGTARLGHVYVENLAHAHLLAADALTPDAPVAGQAYFITDFAPVNFFGFVVPYLEALGYEPGDRSISVALADLTARALELRHQAIPIARFARVALTRYAVAAVTRDFWFNHDRATRDFGYTPIVAETAARDRTLAWLLETYGRA